MVVINYIYTPSLKEMESYMIPSDLIQTSLDIHNLEVDLHIKTINLDDLIGKRLLIDEKTNQINIENLSSPEKKNSDQISSSSCSKEPDVFEIEIKHSSSNQKYNVRYVKLDQIYVCALDVFYPILKHKENTSREVTSRLRPRQYKLIQVRKTRGTHGTFFISISGLESIFSYRLKKQKKLSFVNKTLCIELMNQLKILQL